MDDLDYEYHLQNYKRMYGIESDAGKNSQHLPFVQKQAMIDHALSVFNPLRDWFVNAVTLAQRLRNSDAKYYMQYGAGRRLSMIFYGYMRISQIVHPERESPLSHDEHQELSVDINVIYMNLRGILDNFAWCMLYEKDSSLINQIHANDIGLFSKAFRKKFSLFSNIQTDIQKHDKWFEDLKDKRDPVAHRIPLYIPSSIVTPDEAKLHEELHEKFLQDAAKLDFESADSAFQQMDKIGKFGGFFVHHPHGPFIPLYPTLPTDMAHLIKIGNTVEAFLLGA